MSTFLRRMGFCGVDDSVSPDLLCVLSKSYPWIEWGVLFRSDLAGTPRYPTKQWVDVLFETMAKMNVDVHMAAHLCRDRCQQVIEGDASFVADLVQWGFKRAQINATAANGVIVHADKLAWYASNIRALAQNTPALEFIFQYNNETKPIWDHLVADVPANISILYDASCGLGVEIEEFPSPDQYPAVPCGYAGGIGPATIDKVLTGVQRAVLSASSPSPVWIDMESSLRVFVSRKAAEAAKDEFSINNCMICVRAGLQHGLPQVL